MPLGSLPFLQQRVPPRVTRRTAPSGRRGCA